MQFQCLAICFFCSSSLWDGHLTVWRGFFGSGSLDSRINFFTIFGLRAQFQSFVFSLDWERQVFFFENSFQVFENPNFLAANLFVRNWSKMNEIGCNRSKIDPKISDPE